MFPPDLSPLTHWLGRPDFEALAAGAAAAPDDDAPRLALADWLQDQGDEAAAALTAAGRGVLGGWLAMAWYEKVTGRAANDDMPHLTIQFHPRPMVLSFPTSAASPCAMLLKWLLPKAFL